MRKGTKLYGSYLEQYKIVEHIANGGNSEVYKVEDTNGNVYALKLLNKNISIEKIKRFKNEMAFCIKTDNANIIKIIDNGLTDDKEQIFYVMPYYEKTLRMYINEDHTFQENIQLFINLLEGVKYFHKKGIIHRDIKPENILLLGNDFPIITDFGIAHFSTEELITQIETRIGSKMANFQYAAPEQREKNGVITVKTDIYALGLIFNEMFTKKIPFGHSYKKVSNVDTKYSFLDKIIDKMISQSPNDRFNCVDDIIYEIRALIKASEKEEEIRKLKEIKYAEEDENDVLILEPPKLVDFKYNDAIGKIFLYLDKNVNDEWIGCMTKNSYGELMGFGPEKFRFENNVAMANMSPSYLNSLQQIIDYFKSWVDNANRYYPDYVKTKRERERHEKEEALRIKIEREEKIKRTLESIHI